MRPTTYHYLIVASATILMALIFLTLTTPHAEAHAPEDMTVTYDYDSWEMNITITHQTTDIHGHYVEKIWIDKNGEDYKEYEFSKQPNNDTFSVIKAVEAVDKDDIVVRAEDNFGDEIMREFTVSGPPRPLNLSSPQTGADVVEGTTPDLMINIESGGNPVKRVTLDISAAIGTIQDPVDNQDGSYIIEYLAPLVRNRTREWINITASRKGYTDQDFILSFNITDIPGSNVISIELLSGSLEVQEQESSLYVIRLEAEGSFQTGADVSVVPDTGTIQDLQELGSGRYSFSLSAPDVETDINVNLNISAAKGDLETGELTLNITVQALIIDPESLFLTRSPLISQVYGNSSMNVTLVLRSRTAMIAGANLTVNASSGTITDLTDRGAGNYTFVYHSPVVETEQTVVFSVTAEKNGYRNASLEYSLQIVAGSVSAGSLCIVLSPEPYQVGSEEQISLVISISSNCVPVTGAEISVDHQYGAISNLQEEGDGMYGFTYIAPAITVDLNESLKITAYRTGYGTGSRTYSFLITDSPSTGATMDGVVTPGEYNGSKEFGGGSFTVHWKVSADTLHIAMAGETDGWISIGLDPSDGMEDADMIIGWVDASGPHILDEFSTGKTGPHKPDTELGGTSDILEYGGTESGGVTTIEFTRKLVTGDEYDNDFPSTGRIDIIWALGTTDEPEQIHGVLGNGTLEVEVIDGVPDDGNDDNGDGDEDGFIGLPAMSVLIAICISIFHFKVTKRNRNLP